MFPGGKPIGLLGGTFDPIHIGHLRLAIEVRERLDLDCVRLLPAPAPRLRGAPDTDAGRRLKMVELAVRGVDGLEADGRELGRDGPTRTVDTVEALRRELGERRLCLILGADAYARFDRWVDFERIFELCHVVVARRPGATLPDSGPLAERYAPVGALTEQGNGAVVVCDVPELDISATRIRSALAAGRTVRYLLPDPVLEFMQQEGLYLYA